MDGALGLALKFPNAIGWGNQEELLATLIEVVDAGNRLFHKAHSKKGATQPKPIKVPRPADPTRKKRKATSEDLKAMFGEVRYVPREAGS